MNDKPIEKNDLVRVRDNFDVHIVGFSSRQSNEDIKFSIRKRQVGVVEEEPRHGKARVQFNFGHDSLLGITLTVPLDNLQLTEKRS